ncbi:hypothetical protein EVAR_99314_1 [Eumeta japonica]|uniref:Uncharacterized protein n=1 Tax=Eumeta variegata TaxID=151549 RepID=A0A4C1YTJ3_EUMVA|nr:hypothetical protein EVAR_99314_1 [Eumeta japonica]
MEVGCGTHPHCHTVWQKKDESRIKAAEMRSLRSTCGVSLKGRCRNSDVKERCGLKKDAAIRVEEGVSWWYCHTERTNKSRIAKQVYKANGCDGRAGRGRSRKSYSEQIGVVLKIVQILNIQNQRACIKRLTNVSEARNICKNRTMRKFLVSAYPSEK